MKHYINKQSVKRNVVAPSESDMPVREPVINSSNITEADDEVVFPPDIDLAVYEDSGVKVTNYQTDECNTVDYGEGIGGAISQNGGYNKQIMEDSVNNGYIEECSYLARTQKKNFIPHNMGGKFNFLSIPSCFSESTVVSSMISLMDKYKGKYVCLDLWNADNIRIEKCGFLEEAEEGYILVRGNNVDELTMINLNTIKYINIYCK